MSKHTPGPWKLHQVGDSIERLCPADESGQSILTIVEEGFTKFAAVLNDADACLIAAAPDLLEALKECADLVEHCIIGCDAETAASKARAAIAKAEGQP